MAKAILSITEYIDENNIENNNDIFNPEFIHKYKRLILGQASYKKPKELNKLWKKIKYYSQSYRMRVGYCILTGIIPPLCLKGIVMSDSIINKYYNNSIVKFIIGEYNIKHYLRHYRLYLCYKIEYYIDNAINGELQCNNTIYPEKHKNIVFGKEKCLHKSKKFVLDYGKSITRAGIKKYYMKYRGKYIVLFDSEEIRRKPILLLFNRIKNNMLLHQYKIFCLELDYNDELRKPNHQLFAYCNFRHISRSKYSKYKKLYDDAQIYFYEYVMETKYRKSYNDFLKLKIKKDLLYPFIKMPKNKRLLTKMINKTFKKYCVEFLETYVPSDIDETHIRFYKQEFLDCNIPQLTSHITSLFQTEVVNENITEVVNENITEDANQCCICLESGASTHIFVPCGHKCICEGCVSIQYWDKCPMCRQTITGQPIKVY